MISEARARIYAHKVMIGERTLESIPEAYRTAVRLILQAEGFIT